MSVPPLRKADRLVDQVAAHLRAMILSGELPPGTSLLQEELAARLGVSRTPLRESFRILERDGFVEASRRSNTVKVVDFDAEDAIDLYQVRQALDSTAARLAAQRWPRNRDDVVGVARHITEMSNAIQPPFDTPRYLEAHVAFHLGIVAASGNGRLAQLEYIFRISAQMLYKRIGTNVTRMEQSNEEHREILEAISSGDPARAEAAACAHIAGAMRTWDERPGTASAEPIATVSALPR